MTQEPSAKDVDRRRFLAGAALTGLTLAVGGAMGYVVARDEGGAGGAGPEPGGTPTPAGGGFAPGPTPQGKVAAAQDATLPPLQPSPLLLTYHVQDATVEIAAGVNYNAWTFGGTVPGPVLHVKQGDTIQFTLTIDASAAHSIDFHAARTPWDKNYVTIVPGDSLSFDWKAEFPGIFMYHCGTAPVLHHISNGLYGAVVVDPDPPLEPAREYFLVQSEFYAREGAAGAWDGDMDKMKAARPDLLAFNGVAFQYRDNPLPAGVGEKVRLYVLNAGPTLFSAFHVIGAIFDKVYVDGNPKNALDGVSTYTVAPGQGCTFELTIPEAGKYPFVTHSFAYTELGAVGLLDVT